ncbi:LapA family protein [Geobacter sp. 60473]|uniref:LapA family protein n=1 Tax=Geobacter sp. 60473 TaxID=3080755 RepID=UPI002B2D4A69|nr:LapA family protein [Geobacter sp. 60473]
MKSALVLATALAALMVTFSLQNSQTVQVHFLGWYFEGALVLVLLMSFAIGVLTMYLASLPARFTRSRQLTECRRLLEASNHSLDLLRSEPPDEKPPQA